MAKSKKTILIVEDEKAMAYALKMKLKKTNQDLLMAFDGEEAIKLINDGKPDLILLDLLLPKIDGFQVLEYIHKQGITVPVIVLSNLSKEDAIKKANDLGVVDYFIKSDTPIDEIVTYVERCLNV